MNKYRSFGVTVRPRNGIIKNGTLQKALLKYCNKFEYCSYVFEKENEARHVHIQLFFPEPKFKGDVKKQFLRICEAHIPDWDIAQKKVCVLVKICYNDWIDAYCIDNDIKACDHSDTMFHNPPVDDDEYYPSQEEQDAAKAKSNAADQRFHHLVELYNEHPAYKDNKYPQIYTCAMFIADIMFVTKKIPVLVDDRQRKNLVKCFHAYYNKNAPLEMMMTNDDIQKMTQLQQAGINFE